MRLADRADTLAQTGLVKLATFRGKSGRITLLPRLTADGAGLVTIYSENGTAYLQFSAASSTAAPRSIPTAGAALATGLRQGNWTPDIPDTLLRADAYQDAAGSLRSH